MKIELNQALRNEINTNSVLKQDLETFKKRYQLDNAGYAIILYEAFETLLQGLRDGTEVVDMSILEEELSPATNYADWLKARRVRLMIALGIEIPASAFATKDIPVEDEMTAEEYITIEVEVCHALALTESALQSQRPTLENHSIEVVRRWNDEILPAHERAEKAYWSLLKWRGDYSEVMGTGQPLPPLPDDVKSIVEGRDV